MNWFYLLICLFFAHPGFTQDAEEIEAEKIAQERLNKARHQSIAQSTATAVTEFDLVEKFKNSSILDAQFHKLLQTTFATAKLWERRPEEVRKMIEEGAKGKAGEKLFKQFPKLLDFATEILRDEQAMPKLVSMLAKKEAMKQYFSIWIIILIGSWLIKKYLFPPEPNFMRRFFTSMMFTCATSTVSLIIFYFFFKEELDPSLRIFMRTFL